MKARTIAAVLILIGASTAAHADTTHKHHEHPAHHKVHDAEATEGTRHAQHEHHVYFRPFCRRSRYVTNPSAPCWE